jgi:hypothetical protein
VPTRVEIGSAPPGRSSQEGMSLRINFVLPLLSRTPIGGFRVVFE